MPIKHTRKCGAKTRSGGKCKQPAMDGMERCRLHGGKSTGPKTPEGKARNAKNGEKHGIYAAAVILEHEGAEHLAIQKVTDLKADLAMARLRLLRAEKVHAKLQKKLYNGNRVDSNQLRISFERCDRLARTVGRLEQQQAQVVEVRDLQAELDGLKGRLPKVASGG